MAVMTENELKLLEYLVAHFQSGRVTTDPRTHLPYSRVLADLGFPDDARTVGDSLNNQAMGGLALWLKSNDLPAITGIIINKLELGSRNIRSGMPSAMYFTFHGRQDLDYAWQKQQITAGCNLDWIKELRKRGIELSDAITIAEQVPDETYEGAKKAIFVNAYERSRAARDACIKHYGYCCSVCAFDFVGFYGERGREFIHVHHLFPLSEIGKEYVVDPIRDLRPVCPNCHAMLHRGENIGIEALRGQIEFQKALRRNTHR